MDMIKYNTPQELFTAICDKIRYGTNNNELINHQDIPDKINGLINSDIINEYNELLSLVMSNDISAINNDKIENLNASFRDCTNLTIVNLPECTSIGVATFQGCTSLTTITLPKCTSIGNGAFNSCTNLTTVNLPECTSIGSSCFWNCTNLTVLNLPKCTTLGYQAFSGCSNLTTVNLPKCTSIGEHAFLYCTNLTTIILSDNQVVTLGNINVFNNSPIKNGTGYVYVPDNLVDSYKTATNWSTYANRIKPLSELPSNLKEEYGYE